MLVRPLPSQRLVLIGRAAHDVLADYIDAVELVRPQSVPPVITADADDDHVLAAAVMAQADLLVSGDRHLLTLRSYQNTRIVAPIEAIRLIGAF